MPVLLPTWPPPSELAFGLVSAKNVLTPATGGAEQELLRKGTRYEVTFRLPPLDDDEAMEWSDLTLEGDTLVMEVVQPSLNVGEPGLPVVNGSGYAGTTLPIKGLAAGYVLRKGQWITHLANTGQRFLYRVKTTTTANGSGLANVPIYTLLRRPPQDGETIEIAVPKVEGFVRDMGEWRIGVDRLVGLEFKIRERE